MVLTKILSSRCSLVRNYWCINSSPLKGPGGTPNCLVVKYVNDQNKIQDTDVHA